MGEILSQAEIDALLASLSDGGQSGGGAAAAPPITLDKKREAKRYNFAIPSKFNKEQLRTVEMIFDSYSRSASSYLTAYLRTPCSLEVMGAEQVQYKEFTNVLSSAVVLGIIDFLPLKGDILMELSSSIGFSILDRILGGPGLPIKKPRDLTETEKTLMERIFIQLLSLLPEPMANVVTLTPRLERIETNHQFAQIVQPNEMVLLVTLSVNIGGTSGMFNFCLPYIVIEPIMDKLYNKYWFGQNKKTEQDDHREEIAEKLERALIPVSAVIGRTTILVSDFVNLKLGDVITLDSYIDSDLEVMLGSLTKFRAKPGTFKGKNAIQITGFIGKEE